MFHAEQGEGYGPVHGPNRARMRAGPSKRVRAAESRRCGIPYRILDNAGVVDTLLEGGPAGAADGVNSHAVGWTPEHRGYGAPTLRLLCTTRHRGSCGGVCAAVLMLGLLPRWEQQAPSLWVGWYPALRWAE